MCEPDESFCDHEPVNGITCSNSRFQTQALAGYSCPQFGLSSSSSLRGVFGLVDGHQDLGADFAFIPARKAHRLADQVHIGDLDL